MLESETNTDLLQRKNLAAAMEADPDLVRRITARLLGNGPAGCWWHAARVRAMVRMLHFFHSLAVIIYVAHLGTDPRSRLYALSALLHGVIAQMHACASTSRRTHQPPQVGRGGWGE